MDLVGKVRKVVLGGQDDVVLQAEVKIGRSRELRLVRVIKELLHGCYVSIVVIFIMVSVGG